MNQNGLKRAEFFQLFCYINIVKDLSYDNKDNCNHIFHSINDIFNVWYISFDTRK